MSVVSKAARKTKSRSPAGYVAEDNSGKANIFGVEPKTLYTNSPTAEREAKQGLGGSQGLAVVGVILAVVALVTVGVSKENASTLTQARTGMDEVETLTSIAVRFSSEL